MAAVEVRLRSAIVNEDGDYAITRTIIEGVDTPAEAEERAVEAFGGDWIVRGSAFVGTQSAEPETPPEPVE